MASNYWIKLYQDILRDPKMGRLSDSAFRRCMELFLLAGEQPERDGRLPCSDDIAWELRISCEQLASDLQELEKAGIVAIKEDGCPFIANFAKRQAKVPGAERVKRHRERHRNEPVTPEAVESNEPVTNRYTETDIDKETEKESPPTPPGGSGEGKSYSETTWNYALKCLKDSRTAVTVLNAQVIFSEETGIKQPYLNGDKAEVFKVEREWWRPLREMMSESEGDYELFRATVKGAIGRADTAGFIVSTPESALKTFKGLLGRRKRGVSESTSGGKAGWKPA